MSEQHWVPDSEAPSSVARSNRLDDDGGIAPRRIHSIWLLIGDVAICCAGVGLLFLYCLVSSPRTIFSGDEVLTEVVIRDASLAETLASLKEPINAMPPGYFMGLWLWSKAFGTSEFGLRAFSCLAMSCTWVLCWLLLRNFCSRLTATVATATAIFCSEKVLWYEVNARCYAQYMAAFFAAGLLYVLCWKRTQRAGIAILAATTIAHALLVTTHYVGCIYSASLIVTAALASRFAHRRVLTEYAVAATVGAATAVFCVPFYLGQRTLADSISWPQTPGLSALMDCYQFGFKIRPVLVLILAMCFFAYVAIGRRQRPGEMNPSFPGPDRRLTDAARSGLLGVFTLCLMAALVPAVIFCLDVLVGTKLLVSRYILPSFILWPCVLALTLQELSFAADRCQRGIGGMLGFVVRISPKLYCALLMMFALIDLRWSARNYDENLRFTIEAKDASIDSDAVFVSANLNNALRIRHYGGKVLYLDVATSDNPDAKLHHKIGEALNRRYWPGFLISSEELKNGKWPFLIRRDEWETWRELGLASDNWRQENVGDALLIVER